MDYRSAFESGNREKMNEINLEATAIVAEAELSLHLIKEDPKNENLHPRSVSGHRWNIDIVIQASSKLVKLYGFGGINSLDDPIYGKVPKRVKAFMLEAYRYLARR